MSDLTKLQAGDSPAVPFTPDSLLPLQLDEVRDDAFPCHGQQLRLQAAVDTRRDLVRRRLTLLHRVENLLLALEAMFDVPAQQVIRLLDHRAVCRQQPIGME